MLVMPCVLRPVSLLRSLGAVGPGDAMFMHPTDVHKVWTCKATLALACNFLGVGEQAAELEEAPRQKKPSKAARAPKAAAPAASGAAALQPKPEKRPIRQIRRPECESRSTSGMTRWR